LISKEILKMTKSKLCLMSVLILASAMMTACANNDTPLALTTVTPDETMLDTQGAPLKPMSLIEATGFQGVPQPVAQAAMSRYDKFKGRVRNHQYLSIVDFTQHSGRMRYFLVNLKTGKVDAIPVAHGKGSDPDANGLAQYFSNRINSKMSSLGSYLVNERSQSATHGTVLRLDGLEGTNSNARVRAVIIHSATYVNAGQPKQGMSWGCPAVPVGWIRTVIDRLANGSFMYAYGKGKASTNSLLDDLEFVSGNAVNPAAGYIEDGAAAPLEGEW
jgi:hypothetical protein